MNIFVIRKEEFLKNVDKKTFEGKFKSSKRDIEYTLGHFLVKFVATNFYNAEDVSIYEINKKPKFKNSALNFSISHSNNLICTAFDEEFDLGFDIEFMGKKRDTQKISKFLNLPQTFSEKDFYQYWTGYEAQFKSKNKNLTSFIFEKDYICSVSSSEGDIKSKLKIYEVKIPKNKVSPSELINLKLVKLSKKNENTVEIQEISTASLDFLLPLALKIE